MKYKFLDPVNRSCSHFTAMSTNQTTDNSMPGFVLVTDNVDKNIRPSFQRQDRQTASLHYCHSCAILDRVSISGLSDEPAATELSPTTILPCLNDLNDLLGDFEALISRYVFFALLLTYVLNEIKISRVLVEHMEEYKNEFSNVTWHIPSAHTAEMSSKSKCVSVHERVFITVAVFSCACYEKIMYIIFIYVGAIGRST